MYLATRDHPRDKEHRRDDPHVPRVGAEAGVGGEKAGHGVAFLQADRRMRFAIGVMRDRKEDAAAVTFEPRCDRHQKNTSLARFIVPPIIEAVAMAARAFWAVLGDGNHHVLPLLWERRVSSARIAARAHDRASSRCALVAPLSQRGHVRCKNAASNIARATASTSSAVGDPVIGL